MSKDFSKQHYRDILNRGSAIDDSAQFLDGFTYGVMLSDPMYDSEEVTNIFNEWKKSAEDLEICSSKRHILYASYMHTYSKVKPQLAEKTYQKVETTEKIKKRDTKEQDKKADDMELSVSNDESKGRTLVDEEVPAAIDLISGTSQHVSEPQEKEDQEKSNDFDFASDNISSPCQEKSLSVLPTSPAEDNLIEDSVCTL